MEGNLRLYDKIILGGITVFALYMGIGSLFIHFPWGIGGTAFVFIVWSVVTRAYTYLHVEGRPIEPGDIPEWDTPREDEPEICWDDSRWIVDPDNPVSEENASRVISAPAAPEKGSRIILGPTAAGGEISEPPSKKWGNEDSKENREIADMFRALP
jgi:hypothetical protein